MAMGTIRKWRPIWMAPCAALLFGCSHVGPPAPSTSPQITDISCPIDQGLTTTNLLYRVFPIQIGSQSGTCFTLEIDNRQYIVTARHLLKEGIPRQLNIQTDGVITVPVQVVGIGRGKGDVVVFAAKQQISVTLPVDVGTRGLTLGQSVRFLGFLPTVRKVRPDPLPGNRHLSAPLVMSGVLSGFRSTNDEEIGPSLWIDGQNNRGFSGGPVVFQPLKAPTLGKV